VTRVLNSFAESSTAFSGFSSTESRLLPHSRCGTRMEVSITSIDQNELARIKQKSVSLQILLTPRFKRRGP